MHPAEQYIKGVTSGEIKACYHVRMAYKRHLKDLKKCKAKGWVFDPNYAQKVIDIFRAFKHYKGDYAGQPIILEPWQQAIIWVAYGWRIKKEDGSRPRRFKTIYLEVPKKNGKTTMLAGIATYHFGFDGESGAEVYTAATKRDQAKICFRDIKAFIEGSPELKKLFGIHQNRIFFNQLNSFIEPLSKESNSADGFNPSCAIIDELHRHADADMVNLLRNSMVTRSQGMNWEITTAGTNKGGIGYKHHQYTKAVNTGKFEDDSWWGLIYSLDKGDDWRQPENWYKANPNLGTGKEIEGLQDLVKQAKNDPTNENDVKRYHFNLWVGSDEKWISEERWDASAVEPSEQPSDEELTAPGIECYAGLDLASVSDFNALTLTFYNPANSWYFQKYWFWCPADVIDKRVEKQNMDFHQWVKNGYLRRTPGNVIDTDLLSSEIAEICHRYQVASLAFDKHQAYAGTAQKLHKAGIELVEQQQGIMHMSTPTKELERLLVSGKLTHAFNPLMAWQMGNVQIYRDANDNMKIHKGRSTEKVDGPVSAVMSIAELMHNQSEDHQESPYNEEGLF